MSQDWRTQPDGDEHADAPHYYWGDRPGRTPWVPSEPPRRTGIAYSRGRTGMRKWVFVVLAVALGLLLLKPLLVLAAILIGAVVGLLVLGVLAVGALLLIGRLAFGWRLPTDRGWAGLGGRSLWSIAMRRGFGGPTRFD